MSVDVIEDVHDNLQQAFEGLALHAPDGKTETFGPISAYSSGFEIPFFNRILVFEPPTRSDLVAAVDWQTASELPFWVTVPDSILGDVEALLADVELEELEDEPQPGMVLRSLVEIPRTKTEAEIKVVTTPEHLDDFIEVAAAVFGIPIDVTETLYRSALAADGIRMFYGLVDDQRAACGMLIRSGDVAGVYTIGVREPFRRQGLGEAMTWAVLRAGREAGCRIGVLQSTEMGLPLYERMGFETVVAYHQFEPSD